VSALSVAPFRGVFAIPPTPFTSSGLLDEDSLRQCIEFTIGGGAHGVVGPVNASEFSVLMDDERMRVAEILVEQTAGRLPVVLGVSAASLEAAVRFARHAVALHADAVIAMPPYVRHPTADGAVEFYTQLAAAASPLPVWIQHYIPPQGMTMAPARIAQMLREIAGSTT
jgi:dihydrodipicolinate synthase/N-acetylneuraminate lyase